MKGSCLWCGNPLPKRRRKYCCDDCAFKYWQKYIAWRLWFAARNVALENAGYQCQGCGARGGLEVHHIVPLESGEPRHNTEKNAQDNLRVLCRPCHEKAHHPNAGKPKVREIPKEQMILKL